MREMRGATARAITGMTPVERTSGVIFVPGIGVTLECAPAFASMHRGRCGRTGLKVWCFAGLRWVKLVRGANRRQDRERAAAICVVRFSKPGDGYGNALAGAHRGSYSVRAVGCLAAQDRARTSASKDIVSVRCFRASGCWGLEALVRCATGYRGWHWSGISGCRRDPSHCCRVPASYLNESAD